MDTSNLGLGLNKEQLDYLTNYIFKEFDAIVKDNDELWLWITSFTPIDSIEYDEHRWWITFTAIVSIGIRYFAYEGAVATGDLSVDELGFIPNKHVWEVERRQIMKDNWVTING